MVEYCVMKVSDLNSFHIRDIRENVIEKLRERIESSGFNPARPLSVVEDNGQYIVPDGNHRLKVLQELGITEVPCIIRSGDPYKIAIECNADEDTYAPLDLFDWLDVIGKLRGEGLTQAQIGERVGWSRIVVAGYSRLQDIIVAQVLDLSKHHQYGRETKSVAGATFNFTEGWFRNSGLYDLQPKYQLQLMEDFIADKCNWNNSKVRSESAKYKSWQDYAELAREKLVNQDDLPKVVSLIENGTFRNNGQLLAKVDDFNTKAKDKLICGDALVELERLDDGSIDLVITDPPYGIDYLSNRSQYNKHVTKEGVVNDGLDEALNLIDNTCEILNRKSKADAHFYFFAGWQTCPQFREIISKYYQIRNIIIWDKGNHGAGDLEFAWGNRYEMIIYATKGKKALNMRKADILQVSKLNFVNMLHPTQKPVGVIKELLEVSANTADTVCDPFMGSGSTIKAVKDYGGLNYVGIEIDKEIFEKARALIGGDA